MYELSPGQSQALKIIAFAAFLVVVGNFRAAAVAGAFEIELTEVVVQADADGAEGDAEVGALVEVFTPDFGGGSSCAR